MSEEEIIIVCVYKHNRHIDDSILTQCHKCRAEVWISVHNAHRKPICLGCTVKLSKETDVKFGVTREDLDRAAEEILKMKGLK